MDNWISVKDRLPNTGDEVIIAVKLKPDSDSSRWITKAFSCQGLLNTADIESPELSYWEWCTEDGYIAVADDYEVTHWMPLPDPPADET